MGSSSISKDRLSSTGWPDIEELRHRGHRGGEIRMHRGMIRFAATKSDVAQSLLLAPALTFVWIWCLPLVCRLWFRIFRYCTKALGMEATVSMVPQHWSKIATFSLPFVSAQAGSITLSVWISTTLVIVAVFAATYWFGEEHAPWTYIVRALVFIQASALIYFAFASARFPHDIPTYIMGMLSFGVILIGMIPIVLAFTYYVFDFPIWKKLAISALVMAHLTLFFPLQFTLQAYILHYSILFMPLLYFAFGPFLDVLIFICFYSWAMSWSSTSQTSTY